MSDTWERLASWWIAEGPSDPSYRFDVLPLLSDLLPERRGRVLDLGCGEGHLASTIGGDIAGLDASLALARVASTTMPVVVGRVPDIGFFRPMTFDLVVSVYLLDLVADAQAFFESVADVAVDGGSLVVIINHPIYTAPGSAPMLDDDGEILWRWGEYLGIGTSVEPAGPGFVTYRHRPVGELVSVAARAGWHLEALVERPLSAQTITALPGYDGQDSLPRFLGARWVLDGRVRPDG